MKNLIINIIYFFLLISLFCLVTGCSEAFNEPGETPFGKGVPLYAEVSVDDYTVTASRATHDSNDGWSVATFSSGDKTGLMAVKGIENPEVPGDFSFRATNLPMEYEGRNGSYYRFGNSDIMMDAATINQSSSVLYYPFYENMPDPLDAGTPPGIPLRKLDEKDNIEKCIDFLHTSDNNIKISNGVLKPSFTHRFFTLALQRGEGFKNASDDRIWVVMNNPYTDIRLKQTSETSSFSYQLQYNPEDEDVMTNFGGLTQFKVNKHSVWQAWDGRAFNETPTKYVVCPYTSVYFILIQDDFGNWHNVTDFTLGSSKLGSSGTRYILTIELQNLKVVVRPVYVENWDEELSVSDNRQKGINNYADYLKWVEIYNSYVDNGRDPSVDEELLNYGDGTKTGNETSWRFYINNDFTFQKGDAYQVICLQDTLEGSSTYANYTLSNLRNTMFKEISENGVLRALDFQDVYIINPENYYEPSGAITDELFGGTIENCNIINGVMIGWGATGMVAGMVKGGRVKDCYFSGDVIGKSEDTNYGGMFGSVVENYPPEIDENTDYSGLRFISNN